MNFLRGALILTAAGVAVKILGAVNRIWLSRLLGAEGIGLYQMAYPVYLLFAAVAGAGLPIAVSILVAEKLALGRQGELRQLLGRLLKLFLLAGVAAAVLVYAGAGFLVRSGFISDARAYYGIIAVLPAILLSFAVGVWRGFYQGYQLMMPTAVSQVAEQFGRVVFMLLLAYWRLPYGLEYAAAGAAGGAGVGAVAALLVLWGFRKALGEGQAEAMTDSPGRLMRRLVALVVPVSLANLTIPLNALLDMFFIPTCLLASGLGSREATREFGYLAGMAQPLILLATIPMSALVVNLVPAVVRERERAAEHIRTAVKMTLLLCVPAGLGMSALGGPLAMLLYAEPRAGGAMVHSGPAVILLGLLLVTNGALQGLGQIRWPFFNLLAGLALKIVLLSCWAGDIIECAWATNAHYALTLGLNLLALCYCRIGQCWRDWLKIAAVAGVMALAIGRIYPALSGCWGANGAAVAALLVAVGIYAAGIFGCRIVTVEEFGGRRKWLRK